MGGTCPAVMVGSYEVGAFFVYPVVGARMVASDEGMVVVDDLFIAYGAYECRGDRG